MPAFDYLLPLVSVLVGLAIADVSTSLHRLLRARDRVRWDWLPLAAAFMAALSVLNFWWGFYGASLPANAAIMRYDTFVGFLPFGAILVVLFLLNAAALPDDVPAEGLDLRAFYEGNARSFWFLFALYALLNMAYQVTMITVAVWQGEIESGAGVRIALGIGIPNLIMGAFLLVLSRRPAQRRLHAIGVGVLLVLSAISWAGATLPVPEAAAPSAAAPAD